MSPEIDSMVAWKTGDGKLIMSMNDTKRAAAILRSLTPPLPQKERRRKWSKALADADGWLKLARQDAKQGDYKASRDAALCVIRAVETAMLYEEPEE